MAYAASLMRHGKARHETIGLSVERGQSQLQVASAGDALTAANAGSAAAIEASHAEAASAAAETEAQHSAALQRAQAEAASAAAETESQHAAALQQAQSAAQQLQLRVAQLEAGPAAKADNAGATAAADAGDAAAAGETEPAAANQQLQQQVVRVQSFVCTMRAPRRCCSCLTDQNLARRQ